MTAALRRAVLSIVEGKGLPLPQGKERMADRIARSMCNSAADGDVNAQRLVFDSLEGKPKQETDVNLNHGFSDRFLAAVRSASNPPALSDGSRIIDLVPEPVIK